MLKFNVLFSRQKAKKNKAWADGFLTFDSAAKKISLYESDGSDKEGNSRPLESMKFTKQITVGEEFEMAGYVVQVDSLFGASIVSVAPAQRPGKLRTESKSRVNVTQRSAVPRPAFQPLPTKPAVENDENLRTFDVLFSSQKTKKNKAWIDGKLTWNSVTRKGTILDENGVVLLKTVVNALTDGQEFEMEQFIVQVNDNSLVMPTDKPKPVKRLKKAENFKVPFKAPAQTPTIVVEPAILFHEPPVRVEAKPVVKDKETAVKSAGQLLRMMRRAPEAAVDIDVAPIDEAPVVAYSEKPVKPPPARQFKSPFLTVAPLTESSFFFTTDKSQLFLKRRRPVPTRYKDVEEYFKYLINAAAELVQIQINAKAEDFSKICSSNAKNMDNLEYALRKKGIGLFSDCSLTHFFAAESNSRRFILKGVSKTRTSFSGKDDIFVVTSSIKCPRDQTILVRSTWHSPTSEGALEVAPLNIGDSRLLEKLDDSDLIVLRLTNASCELLIIDQLREFLSRATQSPERLLVTFPLVPYLLESSTNASGKRFAPQSPMLTDAQKLSVDRIFAEFQSEYLLNEDQEEVLRQFCNGLVNDSCDAPIVLCHGVFGAGKSYLLSVLICLVERIVSIDDNPLKTRILVSSNTNVAVDRILISLKEMDFQNFVRVGNVKKVSKSILSHLAQSQSSSEDIKELEKMLKENDLTDEETEELQEAVRRMRADANKDLIRDSFLTGATCIATGTSLLPAISSQLAASSERVGYTILILDECSQITEPLCLLPMALFGCKRAVLVGDPNQLPPTLPASANIRQPGLERTIFTRLEEIGVGKILLRTQYRCHPKIAEICNMLFYQSNLLHGVKANSRCELDPALPVLCFIDLGDTAQEQQTYGGSYVNAVEAKLIGTTVDHLIRKDVENKDIGVISLYKNQVEKLNAEFQITGTTVTVSTVDAFQGGEREVICLSTVRSNGKVGFTDDSCRLNVALSRAKRHMFIFGCRSTLETSQTWKRVISYCQDQGHVLNPEQFLRQITQD